MSGPRLIGGIKAKKVGYFRLTLTRKDGKISGQGLDILRMGQRIATREAVLFAQRNNGIIVRLEDNGALVSAEGKEEFAPLNRLFVRRDIRDSAKSYFIVFISPGERDKYAASHGIPADEFKDVLCQTEPGY